MSARSVEAMRELRDDLDSLIEIAKQGRAPIRAVCLIERARVDLQAYLDEIQSPSPQALPEDSFTNQLNGLKTALPKPPVRHSL